MKRIFTESTGRFSKGEIRDYPIATWRQIEQSAGKAMDAFSKFNDEAAFDGILAGSGNKDQSQPSPVVKESKRRRKK